MPSGRKLTESQAQREHELLSRDEDWGKEHRAASWRQCMACRKRHKRWGSTVDGKKV